MISLKSFLINSKMDFSIISIRLESNNFVSKYIYPLIENLSKNPGEKDYKTRLQEYFAKKGKKGRNR